MQPGVRRLSSASIAAPCTGGRLAKRGSGDFGPTDPARNGPYGDPSGAPQPPRITSYKRRRTRSIRRCSTYRRSVFESLRAECITPSNDWSAATGSPKRTRIP